MQETFPKVKESFMDKIRKAVIGCGNVTSERIEITDWDKFLENLEDDEEE